MAYQNGPSVCPRCGGTAEVRTARELFDTMNAAQAQGFQRLSQQFGWPGVSPAQSQPPGPGQFPGPGQAPGAAQPAGPGPSPLEGQRQGQYAGQAPRAGQYTATDQSPGHGQFHQVQFGQPQSSGPGQAPGEGQAPGPGQTAGQEQAPGQGQGQAAGQEQFGGAGQAPSQNQAAGQAQPAGQPPLPGQAGYPGQGGYPGQDWNRRDDDYDHYSVEGSRRNNIRPSDLFDGNKLADDIGGAVFGAALGFAGRAIGRRMKKAVEERVMPAVQARAQQAQQQQAQQRIEQDAIAARYPELRGCMKDQVIFLDGGSRIVAVSELTLPLTLAQADAVVARLR